MKYNIKEIFNFVKPKISYYFIYNEFNKIIEIWEKNSVPSYTNLQQNNLKNTIAHCLCLK